MGYAKSFSHLETMTATSKTTYSDWFDTGSAMELYCYVDSTEAGTPNSESVAVTVERYLPYRTGAPVTVLTFTAITADTTEEKHAYALETDGSAPDVHNKLGTRCRFKFITSGTWSATSVKVYCTAFIRNR